MWSIINQNVVMQHMTIHSTHQQQCNFVWNISHMVSRFQRYEIWGYKGQTVLLSEHLNG